MEATGPSRLTCGFPLNYASILFALAGIIFNVGLLYPYIERIQILNDILDILDWTIYPVEIVNELLVLYSLILAVYILGILSRIGIVFASVQFNVIILRVSYILVVLELIFAVVCSSLLLERLTEDGPPIATLIVSILQVYCVIVYTRTDQAIQEAIMSNNTGHSGARV